MINSTSWSEDLINVNWQTFEYVFCIHRDPSRVYFCSEDLDCFVGL